MMISTFPAIVMILHPTVWKFSDVSVDYLVSYVASSPALISLSLSLSPLCRRHDADALRCLQSSGRSPVTLVNLCGCHHDLDVPPGDDIRLITPKIRPKNK